MTIMTISNNFKYENWNILADTCTSFLIYFDRYERKSKYLVHNGIQYILYVSDSFNTLYIIN